MVKDKKLYDLLGVSTDADEAQLKKAYRKQALKFHPDKPTGDEEKFKEISEAFDILNDKDKRSVYDQYGLDAARSGQVPMPDFGAGGGPGGPGAGFGGFGGAGGPQTFHFASGPGGAQAFSTDDAFNIFNSFMGGGSMGGMGGMGSGGHPFASFGGGDEDFAFGGMPGGRRGRGTSSKSMRTSPVEPLTIDLPVALRDLYTGTTKKLKIKRRTQTGAQESNIVEVDIKPGWKSGTKLTYKGRGDIQPDGSAQDVVFVIKEKPDDKFTRDGNNLHTVLKLSLKESLLGFSSIVETIDGKRLKVSQVRPVRSGQELRFPDRGMPLGPKHPGQFGDLVVDVVVEMPTTLTPEQREAIEKYF